MGEASLTRAGGWKDRVRKALFGEVPPEYKRDFEERKIETNLKRTFMLSIFIVVIQVVLNAMNIVLPGGDENEDIMKYVVLSMLTLLLGVVFLVISILIRQGKLRNMTFRKYMPLVLLTAYCWIQMIFLSFNSMSEASMNCYIIALVLVGFFLILPPIVSIVSIAFYLAVAVSILTYFGGGGIWGAILTTDTWANLVIITVLVGYMSCVVYGMYRSDFLNKKRLEVSNSRLEHIAKTDSLTGLLNRWGFFGIVDREWDTYFQKEGIVAICMFDIDFFKEFNDAHGHLAGDECLHMVSTTIKGSFSVENEGIVCRFGGEEFLALARVRTQAEALALAEQIREAVRSSEVVIKETGEKKSVTISGGVASAPGNSFISCDALIKLADDALYEAKGKGRNQVRLARL